MRFLQDFIYFLLTFLSLFRGSGGIRTPGTVTRTAV